jgi:hypothetical protein
LITMQSLLWIISTFPEISCKQVVRYHKVTMYEWIECCAWGPSNGFEFPNKIQWRCGRIHEPLQLYRGEKQSTQNALVAQKWWKAFHQ